MFHGVSSLKNAARCEEAHCKDECLFYASPLAKGKRLYEHVADEAAPTRLQAFRKATLSKNEDIPNNILRVGQAKTIAHPDDGPVKFKSHANTRAFLNMNLESFFAYLVTQRMDPIPPRRDTDQIEGPASTTAIIMSLGGNHVLEVKSKNQTRRWRCLLDHTFRILRCTRARG